MAAELPVCAVTLSIEGSSPISFASISVSGGLRRHGQLSRDPLQLLISAGHFVMKKVVGPAAAMLCSTPALMPCTAADMIVTTKTPTAIPRIVRPARTLFAPIASKAMTTPSKRMKNVSRRRMLLGPQRHDGVEARGATRRVHPGDDPDHRADADREDDRPGRDLGGQGRH